MDIAQFVTQVFRRWATENKFSPSELKSYSIGLISSISGRYSLDPPLQDLAQKIFACDSLDQLISVLSYLLGKSYGKIPSYTAQIHLAQQAIREKLGESVGLKTIASEVGLSPNYFSRIFSEQTGKGWRLSTKLFYQVPVRQGVHGRLFRFSLTGGKARFCKDRRRANSRGAKGKPGWD